MSRKTHVENENAPEGLIGRKAYIELRDRAETTFSAAEIVQLDALGATITWQSRGKNNVSFIPLSNISYISSQAKGEASEELEEESEAEA